MEIYEVVKKGLLHTQIFWLVWNFVNISVNDLRIFQSDWFVSTQRKWISIRKSFICTLNDLTN